MRLANALKDLVDEILKRRQSAETALDSPNSVGVWERTQEAVQVSMSGKSPTSDTRTSFEEALSNLRRTLAGTSGPKAFQSYLRKINLNYLSGVTPLNPSKWIRISEVDVPPIFSAFYLRLCVILNDIRVAQSTHIDVDLLHLMDCVLWSVMDMHPQR